MKLLNGIPHAFKSRSRQSYTIARLDESLLSDSLIADSASRLQRHGCCGRLLVKCLDTTEISEPQAFEIRRWCIFDATSMHDQKPSLALAVSGNGQ